MSGKTFGKCGGEGQFPQKAREMSPLCSLSGRGQEQAGESVGMAGPGKEGALETLISSAMSAPEFPALPRVQSNWDGVWALPWIRTWDGRWDCTGFLL